MNVLGGLLLGFLLGAAAAATVETPSPRQDLLRPAMTHVEGIGGVFLRAEQPDSLRAWYRRAFDLPTRVSGSPAGTSFEFQWGRLDGQGVGRTVWSVFGPRSEYMGSLDRQCMINYRVRDMRALVRRLDSVGIPLAGGPDAYDNGLFAWLIDPAGNRVELWEPHDPTSER